MNLQRYVNKLLIFFLYLAFINPCSGAGFMVKHSFATGGGKLKKINKIFGGRTTSIKHFPSLVAIFEKTIQICGGTIISTSAVISAAHCFDFKRPGVSLSVYKVRAGSTYRSIGGTFYDLSRLVIHRGYNESTSSYDFALLKVRKPFEISPSVAISEIVSEKPSPGSMATVVGWGATTTNDYSEDLNEVEVVVLSKEECQRKMSEYMITNSMLCAGYAYGGKDTCQGDSGGPLYVNNKLAGVTSWGAECGSTSPGVYSNVAHVLTWVNDFIHK